MHRIFHSRPAWPLARPWACNRTSDQHLARTRRAEVEDSGADATSDFNRHGGTSAPGAVKTQMPSSGVVRALREAVGEPILPASRGRNGFDGIAKALDARRGAESSQKIGNGLTANNNFALAA